MVESSHPPEVTDDAASRSPAEELLPAKVPLSVRWLHTHTHKPYTFQEGDLFSSWDSSKG